jgi:hypothetical protein
LDTNGTTESNGLAKRAYTPMRLGEARENTPAPTGPGTWASQLKEAAKNAVSVEDVAAIVQQQVEKAKAGDAAAVKFVMGFIAAESPQPQPVKEIKIIEKVKIINGGKAKRSTKVTGVEEPPRVAEAEPTPAAAPVAIDSPSLRQLRKLVGLHLAQVGVATLASIEAVLEIPADSLRAVLNHPWFAQQRGDGWSLTPEGNQHCK